MRMIGSSRRDQNKSSVPCYLAGSSVLRTLYVRPTLTQIIALKLEFRQAEIRCIFITTVCALK